MGTTNEHKIFALSGETDSKDSHNILFRQQYPALFNLLDSCPFLAFSSVGKRNVCNRFHIAEQTLEQVLLTYVRIGELTESERRAADLAHLGIGKALTHKDRVSKKGGMTC